MRKALPRGFGWIDHRLLRDGHIGRASIEALALYLLLACASDAQGLSFYSDGRAAQLLGVEEATVGRARRELIRLGLILYRRPVYQLLSLEQAVACREQPRKLSPATATLPQPARPTSTEAAQTAAPVRFPLRAAVEAALKKGAA